MEQRFRKNIFPWIKNREQSANAVHKRFQRALHVTYSFAERLGLEKELKGHGGCVNCLQWSEDGRLLISGSDDFNIIIWEALRHCSRHVINSGHSGNIFSVKFLPLSNDNIVASAAADAKVRIHNVNNKECIQVYSCHFNRVKRLAVVPQMPFMVWSGSEDGTVRQHDLRQPHSCASNNHCSNIIINLNAHVATSREAKCISINPMKPELIAVGSGDAFVRIYDTRMLTLHSMHDARGKTNGRKIDEMSPPEGCVTYFSPGHIPQRYGRDHPQRYRHYTVTYLSFSPDGREILANLGGEHVYLFDTNSPQEPLKYTVRQLCATSVPFCPSAGDSNAALERQYGNVNWQDCTSEVHNDPVSQSIVGLDSLPRAAFDLKAIGNEAFSKQNYYHAIACYNQALNIAPKSAILFANRAAAFLKRGWEGDIYAALADCHMALKLDPLHSKAHYRQARCLYELRWYQEALYCLNDFKFKFPEQADGYFAKKLEKDIKESTVNENEDDDDDGSNASRVPKRRRRKPHPAPSESERLRQENAYDYDQRFVGACNTTTDIKEANFFGNDGQFIVAGSDCGCMFLWDRSTTNLVEAWHGDESIVNCLQPHPHFCLLATSGIDPVVRLWTPQNRDTIVQDPRREKELEGLVKANQKRMNADPLEMMLMNMGYRARIDDGEGDSDDDANESTTVQCRTH